MKSKIKNFIKSCLTYNRLNRILDKNLNKKNISTLLNKIKKNEVIKLNLGVGHKPIEGFIGVDANPGRYTNVICDLKILPKKIPKNSINEIYSRHVIEHFPREKIPGIIKSWVGMLKKGGKITLNFPDLDRYIDFYIANRDKIPIDEFARWIFGNQNDQYDLHRSGFNGDYISKILKESGMKIKSIKPSIVGNGLPPKNKAMIGTEVKAVKE